MRLFQTVMTVALSSACLVAQGQLYRLTDLGTLSGGQASSGTAANDVRQATGYSSTPLGNTVFHAFLYSNGTMQDLGTLGGSASFGYGINALGQVTGNANNVGDFPRAFLYSNGQMQDLGTLGGSQSFGYAINDSGLVVGASRVPGDLHNHAFLYSNGQMQDIGTLGGTDSLAFAINASGQVAGEADTTASVPHAFIYSNGQMQDLGTLGGTDSIGYGINASGQVAGTSEVKGNASWHAFLYANGQMIDLHTLPGGTGSTGSGISANGEVVGSSSIYGDKYPHAFLYANGQMKDLNSLVDTSGSGYIVRYANGVSDAGDIAAQAYAPDGFYHAVMLTPYFVDLPTSYSIYRGTYVSGDLSSLFTIDGNYLVVRRGVTLTAGEAPVSIVLSGTATNNPVTDLRLSLTAHANVSALSQKIEMYDYSAGAWVTVANRPVTTSDSTQVGVGSNPGRFVQPGTNAVSARVSWTQTGPTPIGGWSIWMDQIVWNDSP